MNINGISEYNTAAVSPDSSVHTREKKTEEAGGTQAAAVYTEGSDTGEVLNNTDTDTGVEEQAKQDSVYKKEEEASGKEPSQVTGQATEEDYKAMEEEGISMEKFELERLDRMLARVKEQRTFKEESIAGQQEKLETKIAAQQNIAFDYSRNKELIDRLNAANIPVTKANLLRISSESDKAASALAMSDQTKYYLIKNRMEPTLDNIYKASYSSAHREDVTVNESQWESIKPQAAKIMEEAGIPVNEEFMGNARWLFTHNLGITENNLWAGWDLDSIKTNLTGEDIKNRVIAALSRGDVKSPSLSFLAEGQIAEAGKKIDRISDDAIKSAIIKRADKERDSLSIRELYKEQRQLEAGSDTSKRAGQEGTGNSGEEIDIRTITVRRRLEEIRLKMTADAGGELIKKGFHLETDSLQRIVDGLKEIEDRYYRDLLKEGGLTTEEDNVNTVKNSLSRMEELKGAPAALLGSTLRTWQQETPDTLTALSNDYKKNLASQTYEALMTKPRADMGDSISKAFSKTDSLLEEMGLKDTEANRRALRILGYNNMPLTSDNIDTVKLHDAQVNNVLKNFHPAVAVEFIRRGINPVNIPIEELNNQINILKDEMGIDGEERFSKYLWKLEKNDGIEEEEKQSFIGLYRLFNALEKTDGAALGAVVKADQNLTLKNLLTAARTRRSGGIEASVDDNFGALTGFTPKGESISEQINTAYSQRTEKGSSDGNEAESRAAYAKELLREVTENLTPEGLKALGGMEGLKDITLEQLAEGLGEQEKTSEEEYYREKLNQLREISAGGRDGEGLLKAANLPVTLSGIMAAGDFLQSGNTAFQRLNNLLKNKNILTEEEETGTEATSASDEAADGSEMGTGLGGISEKLLESMDSRESIHAAYAEMESDVRQLLQNYYDRGNLTSKDIGELKRISNGIQFITQMAARENYQVPLITAQGVTNVNVTLLKNTGDTGRAAIRVPSGKFGNIELNLSVKNNETSAFITCDTREGLEALKENQDALIEALSAGNTKIKQINYGIGNHFGESGRYNNYRLKDEEESNAADKNTGGRNEGIPAAKEESADTDTLLKLAKAFILHIKELVY